MSESHLTERLDVLEKLTYVQRDVSSLSRNARYMEACETLFMLDSKLKPYANDDPSDPYRSLAADFGWEHPDLEMGYEDIFDELERIQGQVSDCIRLMKLEEDYTDKYGFEWSDYIEQARTYIERGWDVNLKRLEEGIEFLEEAPEVLQMMHTVIANEARYVNGTVGPLMYGAERKPSSDELDKEADVLIGYIKSTLIL